MFDKFVLWILGKAYRYHKIREIRYYDRGYDLFIAGYTDEDYRYLQKAEYHNKRCRQIDRLIYEIEES
jgi:hypothetical protein